MPMKKNHTTCHNLCFIIVVTLSIIGLASVTNSKMVGLPSFPLHSASLDKMDSFFQKKTFYPEFINDFTSYPEFELVFNWLEFSFPDYLSPANQQTRQTAEGIAFRYYSGTNSYLAIYENILYYLDNCNRSTKIQKKS